MRALAIGRVIFLAVMWIALCGSLHAQSRPPIVSDYGWSNRTTLPDTSHRADASNAPHDGVILNVFPDLTPGAGEFFQESSPPTARPQRRQPGHPSRHGLPTPRWRRNPLLPQGKSLEA